MAHNDFRKKARTSNKLYTVLAIVVSKLYYFDITNVFSMFLLNALGTSDISA